MRLDFFAHLRTFVYLRLAKLILDLQVEPEAFTRPEIAGESQGGISRYATIFPDNLVDPGHWNMQRAGQSADAHSCGLQIFFPDDLSRVNGAHSVLSHDLSSSMVVDNFYTVYRLTASVMVVDSLERSSGNFEVSEAKHPFFP